MRKLVLAFISSITVLACSSTAFAKEVTIEPSRIIAVHENVSMTDAMKDSTFNYFLNQKEQKKIQPFASAGWECWGERVNERVFDSFEGAYRYLGKPVGYSRYLSSSGSVVSKYHYTRTFINISGDYRGDSGRIWGYETVKASGTPVEDDVWTVGQHQVYYGTTA